MFYIKMGLSFKKYTQAHTSTTKLPKASLRQKREYNNGYRGTFENLSASSDGSLFSFLLLVSIAEEGICLAI